MKNILWIVTVPIFVSLISCNNGELNKLRDENSAIKSELDSIKGNTKSEEEKVVPVNEEDLIAGATNKVIWGKGNTENVELKLNYFTLIKPILLTIGFDHPNGTKFIISFKDLNVAVNLRYVMNIKRGFNEWGDLNDDYYVQAASYDFDGDKNPEIIIAIGDGLTDMSINIIKFHPPSNSDDAIRTENWTVIGNFQGQGKIEINKNIITAPFGSQGLFEEYTYVNNKFVKTE